MRLIILKDEHMYILPVYGVKVNMSLWTGGQRSDLCIDITQIY